MRFLVIDDNKDTARMIAMLLERRFEADIDIEPTCADARAALENNSYDVITLDYQLPDCSGLDMLDEITSADEHPPVVMITGHGDEELAYLTFRMGASGYAAKDRKLSVSLPEAVEWALADAALKKSRGGDKSDQRLEGLFESIHAASIDLRLELDALKTASDELSKPGSDCGPDTADRLERVRADIEQNLQASYRLVSKLDALVHPVATEGARHRQASG